MSNSFYIIAVRVLKGCEPYIRKILKEDTTYFLRNEYEYDDETGSVRKKQDAKGVPDSFFCVNSENTDSLKINISAIVGKNGDGKSSLVELVIRILNNFAYASGFAQATHDLRPIEGVCGILFYGIGDKVFSIESRNDTIIFKDEIQHQIKFHLYNHKNNIDYSVIEHASEIFYTLVLNYSMYAYNPEDLNKEHQSYERHWINSIFHKNDGYQTPIVLNPFRKKGNIDVNIENSLNKQRLMAMFVDGSITEINKNEIPLGFAYELETESKLFKKTMGDYFISKMKYSYTYNVFMYKIDSFFFNKLRDAMDDFRFLFEKAKHIIFVFCEMSNINGKDLKTDLSEYFKGLLLNNSIEDDTRKTIGLFLENGYDCMNLIQLERILYIIDILHLWNNICKFRSFNHAISFSENENYNDSTFQIKCYILYKAIGIIEKYDFQYEYSETILTKHWNSPRTSKDLWIEEQIKNSYSRESALEIWNLIDDIINIKSHKTLKIRQALNFQEFNYEYKYLNLKSDSDNNVILEQMKMGKRFGYYVPFSTYQTRIDYLATGGTQLIELLPPPIFSTEIIIKRGSQPVLLSSLSSGERQLLNSVCSVAYYLRNIDSISCNTNTIAYKYVNLIFEEIELYFHPEFQQKYLLFLLTILSRMRFKQLKAVNICIVTHSPFILSDIPKNNVLFLENGQPAFPMQEDTFGANIHTLLHNGFFLSNVPIGMFAKHKINVLFGKLYQGEVTKEMRDEIILVSEPVLRTQLIKLYRQNMELVWNDIEKLKNEIEMLKNEWLNKMN